MPSPVQNRGGRRAARRNDANGAVRANAVGASPARSVASSPSRSSAASSSVQGRPAFIYPGLAGSARYIGVDGAPTPARNNHDSGASGRGSGGGEASGGGDTAKRSNGDESSSSSGGGVVSVPPECEYPPPEDWRLIRVEIEDRVRLTLSVRDTLLCLACCELETRRFKGKPGPKYCFWSDNPATISEEEKHLLNKMRVLSDEELLECLEIHPDDVMDQLGREITCVTCRKVARQRATAGPDSMASVVSPITVEDDGYLRIDAELAKCRQNLARLLVGHSNQLQQTVHNAQNGTHLGGPGPSGRLGASKRGGGGGAAVRCKEHEAAKTGGVVVNCGNIGCTKDGPAAANGCTDSACGGACGGGGGGAAGDGKKPVSPRLEKWMQTWKSLGEECQRAVLLIMNDKLHDTMDAYLNRHSFCHECTAMVNQAYEQLVDPVSFSERAPDLASLPPCNKKGKKSGKKGGGAASAPPPPPTANSSQAAGSPSKKAATAVSNGAETSNQQPKQAAASAAAGEEDEDLEDEIDDDEQQQQEQEQQQQQQKEKQPKQQQQNGAAVSNANASGDGQGTSSNANSSGVTAHQDYIVDTSGTWRMATKKAASVYYECRIWSSAAKQAVFVSQRDACVESLLVLAEPLYAASWSSAAKQADRHAKTMEVARREMMVCVGLILCERLTKLDFGLFEAAQACCQVARATLLAARCAVEMAVEARGDALEHAEEEDRQAKAQKKKEKKQKQQERRRQQLEQEREEREEALRAQAEANKENGIVVVEVMEEEQKPEIVEEEEQSKPEENAPVNGASEEASSVETTNGVGEGGAQEGHQGGKRNRRNRRGGNTANNQNGGNALQNNQQQNNGKANGEEDNSSNAALTEEEIANFKARFPDNRQRRIDLRETLKAKFLDLMDRKETLDIKIRPRDEKINPCYFLPN